MHAIDDAPRDDVLVIFFFFFGGIVAGVDPIYVKFLKEAERHNPKDYKRSHLSGERSVILGPTGSKNFYYTKKALMHARRIRNILGPSLSLGNLKRGGGGIHLAIMMDKEHLDLLRMVCKKKNKEARRKEGG